MQCEQVLLEPGVTFLWRNICPVGVTPRLNCLWDEATQISVNLWVVSKPFLGSLVKHFVSETITLLNYENNIIMKILDNKLWDSKCAIQEKISCMACSTQYRLVFPFNTPWKKVFWCFQGVCKGNTGRYWLTIYGNYLFKVTCLTFWNLPNVNFPTNIRFFAILPLAVGGIMKT